MATNRCCRNIIIDNLLGIIPVDSCPPIIQTVADIADAVAGTVVGQLTIARWADGSKYHIHLYEWDGANWVLVIDTTTGGSLTEFDSLEVESIVSPWEITVDQGVVWTDSTVTFDPVVTSIEVWFRNTTSGCVYANVPIIPIQAEYCVETFEVDTSTDPFFFFGSINGIMADDINNVIATYIDWEGNLTSRANINIYGSSPGLISIFRDSLTPAFSNLGTYVPFGGGDPVVWAPSTVNCTPHCYQAVFTVNDLSTDSLTSLTLNGVVVDYTNDFPLIDPVAAAAHYMTDLIAGNVLEPSATMTITLNGLEVTMTICTVMTVEAGAWSDGVTQQGTFNFTQL